MIFKMHSFYFSNILYIADVKRLLFVTADPAERTLGENYIIVNLVTVVA